ncbi:membrane fusion protein, epimerase transport system [Tranquillimonas rosea]|uniref:Membrane fusion protein (MFP) family protein n=1 Tax=Tranquillimonas rosea TaxID=641238 RepID=A0A1H9WYN0_9RHOB|nr:HlyD family type I secretion periplasmic adaptor subunit [Tranquillimonas rosea]SES39022.1 membrane fusion protein, epimerase transport system [Tranquillimonas rosea]
MSTDTLPTARAAGDLTLRDALPPHTPGGARPPTRIRGLIFLLVLMIAGFWGGLGTWAARAPLHSAVVATGNFRVEGDLPVVQHLEGGLLREVRVTEGERVTEGQVLAVLDGTMTGAQDNILLSQLVNALANDERLAAEFRDAAGMTLSDELVALTARDASFGGMVQAQRELFETNREMWRGQVEILRKRVEELNEQLVGLAARQAALTEQLGLVQDELGDLKVLHDKGLVTKTRYLSRREAEVSLLGDLNILDSQVQSVRQRISETEERILQVRRDRARQITEERQAVKERIFEIRQRIVANEDVKERLLVRAPRTGKVLGLRFTAPGEVIQDGEEILRIVPDGARYVVEAQVRPEDVDQVAEGAASRVRLTAYNFRTTPPVEGEVVHVSADSLVDEATGRGYFLVKVRVPEAALEAVPDVEVQPGMPAQVMIATGEQTVADYILSPVLGGMSTAMKESNN